MAIKNNFKKYGTTFNDAYHRISSLSYNVVDEQVTVEVSASYTDDSGSYHPAQYENQWQKVASAYGTVLTYASEDARNAHSESLSSTPFDITIDLDSDDNWMEQSYTYLKTTAAFTGSTDIL